MHDCYRRCFVGPSGFAFGLQTAPRVKKKIIRNKYVLLGARNFGQTSNLTDIQAYSVRHLVKS
jgi:hypothetical protein